MGRRGRGGEEIRKDLDGEVMPEKEGGREDRHYHQLDNMCDGRCITLKAVG